MVDWNKTAALFPGQGSQAVGMGADFAREYEIGRDTFAAADEILGFALSRLCFEGPADELDQTTHTQPALYVCSLAIWRVLQDLLPAARPAFMAGHSLGEFSALTAAGALSFEDGLPLVAARGRLMAAAGERNPGAMAALLGLEADAVADLCRRVSHELGATVVLANDNCPGQAVVSGENSAVEAVMQLAGEAGARRVVKLAVSVAAHSPLMESAQPGFREALDRATFSMPSARVFGNVDARPLENAAQIRAELERQLTRTVRWTGSLRAMFDAGVDSVIEVGSGTVLTGLTRRVERKAGRVNLNTVGALERFVEAQA